MSNDKKNEKENNNNIKTSKIDVMDKNKEEIENSISQVKVPTKRIDINTNGLIQEEIKNSDIKEQVKNNEQPDTPREVAEKEAILKNDKSLSAQMDSYINEQNKFVIPKNIAKQYVVSTDNKTFFDKTTRAPMITITKNNSLTTKNNDEYTINNMLQLAKANKWTSIKINGTKEFRREAWAQAKLAGLEVKGYTATVEEKKFVEAKIAEKNSKNNNKSNNLDPKINTMEQQKASLVNAFKNRASAILEYVSNKKGLQEQKEQRKVEIKEQSKEKEKEIEK